MRAALKIGKVTVVSLLALLSLNGCDRDRSVLLKLKDLEAAIERDPSNTNSLQELLRYSRDRSSLTRANAIAILGHFGQQEATWVRQHVVPALKQGLKDQHQSVRRTASSSFGGLRPADYESALPELIGALAEGDVDVAWFAAEAIGRLGSSAEPAVTALTKALQVSSAGSPDNAPQLRKFAAQALGAIGPSAQISAPLLKMALDDSNPHFRVEVVIALSRIEQTDSSHLPMLADLLGSQEVGVRRRAIEPFLESPPTNAVIVAAITKCLNDPDDYVKKSAATILEERNK